MLSFVKRWPLFSAFLGILTAVTLFHPYYRSGPPIRSDGVGYHLWTRAILSLNLNFCEYLKLNPDVSEIQGAILPPNPKTGVCQNKYPPGLALLRFPMMAPWIKQGPQAPLISKAEHHMSLVLGMLALVLLCFLCLRTLSSFEVQPQLAELALLFGVLGTGLFHYATFDGCFTHIYSALGISILVWSLCKTKQDPCSRKSTLVISAVTIFFLILTRNTNIFLVAFYGGALSYRRLKSPDLWRHNEWRAELLSILGACSLAIGIQLGYNFFSSGVLSLSSYGKEVFLWTRPMVFSTLFSYERGLFTYYPVIGVMLASGLSFKPTRLPALYFAGILLFYASLYGFWHSWMLGEGFGHRGFIELSPPLIVLLGVSLKGLAKRIRWLALGFGALGTWVTLQIMWGYWQATFPFSGATSDAYWTHIFPGKHLEFQVLSAGFVLVGSMRAAALRQKA